MTLLSVVASAVAAIVAVVVVAVAFLQSRPKIGNSQVMVEASVQTSAVVCLVLVDH